MIGHRPITKVTVLGLRGFEGTQGGIETHVRTLVSSIVASRDDFVFEILERTPYASKAQLPGVTLTALWSPKFAALETIVHSFAGVLYAAIRRPDILHVHGIGPSLILPLAKLAGLRVVTTHHGEDYAREKWGPFARTALRLGEGFALRLSEVCIVVAPGLADRLRAKFRRPVRFVPNALPFMEPATDQEVLASFGLQAKSYFVHVGRFVPEKRQLELIDAFGNARISDWKLVLVGDADHRGGYSEQVRAKAATVPNVVVTGVQVGSALSTLLANAGAFILPSSHEGLPISLLEAMHFGLPVAVSDIENMRALSLPQVCYFEAANGPALVDALLKLRSMEGVVVDWNVFLQKFRMDQVAEETVSIYEQCLRKGSPG